METSFAWYFCAGEKRLVFQLFWAQVAIFALMTFISDGGHIFCCDGSNIDSIPCDDCGAGY